MHSSVKQQYDSHGEWLLISGIIITLLAREWNYSIPDFTLPKLLYYPGWFAGLFCPLAYIIMRKRISVSSGSHNILSLFFFLLIGCLLVLSVQMALYPAALATYDLWTMLQFAALPVWGLAGFIFASRPETSFALLDKFAACAAWGSFYSFGMRLIQTDPTSIPFGAAGWPMRLFFLFGFCWYLSRFLLVKPVSFMTIFALTTCSLEVIFTLHKPIIFGTLFSVLTLLLIIRPRLQIRKIAINIIKLTLPAVVVLAVVNSIYDGIVVEEFNDFLYQRVLRVTDPDEEISFKTSSSGRFDIWEAAWNDFTENPWVGTGLKNITTETGTISLHNGYLDLLFILGVCGALPVLFGSLIWFRWVRRSLNWPPLLLAQSSCLAYIVGIMMFNTGGMSRLFPGPSYFVLLVCGITLRVAVDNWQKNATVPDPVISKLNNEPRSV